MPLDVEHAEVTLEALEDAVESTAPARPGPMGPAAREALKDRLRPLVLEILDEELAKHRRSQGR